MMKIEFKTGNAAFNEDEFAKRDECIRILKEVIKKIECGGTSAPCIDINGNKVGEWSLD